MNGPSTKMEGCRVCSSYTSIFLFSILGPIRIPLQTLEHLTRQITITTQPPLLTTTITITDAPIICIVYQCAPPTSLGPTMFVKSTSTKPSPTLSSEAYPLIDAIRTATLYTSLLANGPFPDVLCKDLSPQYCPISIGTTAWPF